MMSFLKSISLFLAVYGLICGGFAANAPGEASSEHEYGAENEETVSISTPDSENVISEKKIDFSIGSGLRDPFWPVGYMPPSTVAEEEKQEQPVATDEQRKVALSRLRYGGSIQSGDTYYATVNGALVQEGDVVAVTVDGELFKFRVHSINMNGVRFRHVD